MISLGEIELMGKKNKNLIFGRVEGNFIGGDYIHIESEKRKPPRLITYKTDLCTPFYYTGRNKELKDLIHMLSKEHCLINIFGMEGIGKTCLMQALFKELYDSSLFEHIGMINYKCDFDSSLMKYLKYDSHKINDNQILAAWNELEYIASDGRLLLLIDQVDVPFNEDPGLERLLSIPCSIVICSNNKNISDKFILYPLEFLSQAECVSIYKNIRKSIQEDEELLLTEIIDKTIKRHTLAVVLLAKLAETKDWTISELNRNLLEKSINLSFTSDGQIINLQDTFTEIFKLANLLIYEINTLEGFSLVPSLPIRRELCNELFIKDSQLINTKTSIWHKINPFKKKNIESYIKCDDCIKELERQGLLENVSVNFYYIHPVIAMTMYNRNLIYDKNHINLIQTCCERLDVNTNYDLHEMWNILYFAIQIANKVNFNNIDLQINLCFKIAKFYSDVSYHSKSIYWNKRIKELIDNIAPAEQLYMMKQLDINIANQLIGNCQYDEAINKFQKTLFFMLENGIETFDEVVNCYIGLSSAFISLNKASEAFIACCKCLKYIRRNNHNIDDLSTCNVLYEIDIIFDMKGKYQSQLKCLNRIKDIYEKIHLEEFWEEWARLYERIGNAYYNMRDNDNALIFYRNALDLFKNNSDYILFNTCQLLLKIADIYAAKNNIEAAEEYTINAISFCERDCTENQLALIYNDAAITYSSIGMRQNAFNYKLKSHQLYTNIYPKWHKLVIISNCNLASEYGINGDLEKAKEYINISIDALNLYSENEREEHILVFLTSGKIFLESGLIEEGLKWMKEAYSISLRIYGKDHINTKALIGNIKYNYNEVLPHSDFLNWLES